jgi:peptide/nickel transport system substrate-binding protein
LAKSLLLEAGWQEKKKHWQKDGRKLDIEISVIKEVPELVKLATGLKLQLSKLKVNVKFKAISAREIAPNGFEAVLLNIMCGGDPDKLRRFWHSESKVNLASYHNSEVDELLDWSRNVVSVSKRKAIYHRIQEMVVSDQPAAFLCTSVHFFASNYALENVGESFSDPNFFPSVKSWTIKRSE